MKKDEEFDIRKWHNIVASSELVREKVHLPMIEKAKLSSLEPNSIIIDMGCGSAELIKNAAKNFPKVIYIGIDKAPKVLMFAKQNLKAAGFNIMGPVALRDFKQLENLIREIKTRRGKKCILLKENYLEESIIRNFADVVFFSFHQRNLSPQLQKKLKKCNNDKLSSKILFRFGKYQYSFTLLQALNKLKIGGSFVHGSYAAESKKGIAGVIKNIEKLPYAKVKSYSIRSGKGIAEVVLNARFSRGFAENINKINFFIYKVSKTSNSGLMKDLNSNLEVLEKLTTGDFELQGNTAIIKTKNEKIKIA